MAFLRNVHGLTKEVSMVDGTVPKLQPLARRDGHQNSPITQFNRPEIFCCRFAADLTMGNDLFN
jgi:hypothetical protein